MVVSAAGALSHDALIEMVEQQFTLQETHTPPMLETGSYQGGDHRRERKLEQLHFTLGLEGFSTHDPDHYALQILSIILGGGMSSRLFQEVRETRGLAYTVQSFTSSYADTGLLGIYAATAPEKAAELVPVLCAELQKMTRGVTPAELRRGRNQYVSGVVMARESSAAVAEWIGRHLLVYGEYLTAQDIIRKAEAVTEADIARVAQRLLENAVPTTAALGPLGALELHAATAARLHGG